MSNQTRNRISRGVTEGGQFTTGARSESEVSIAQVGGLNLEGNFSPRAQGIADRVATMGLTGRVHEDSKDNYPDVTSLTLSTDTGAELRLAETWRGSQGQEQRGTFFADLLYDGTSAKRIYDNSAHTFDAEHPARAQAVVRAAILEAAISADFDERINTGAARQLRVEAAAPGDPVLQPSGEYSEPKTEWYTIADTPSGEVVMGSVDGKFDFLLDAEDVDGDLRRDVAISMAELLQVDHDGHDVEHRLADEFRDIQDRAYDSPVYRQFFGSITP